MKANEAPEKIYLQDSMSTDTIGDLWPEWFDVKVSDNSIEYIRTDAFIEKVVRFMKKIGDTEEYTWYNEEEHAAGITEKCIEDFKKYIREE